MANFFKDLRARMEPSSREKISKKRVEGLTPFYEQWARCSTFGSWWSHLILSCPAYTESNGWPMGVVHVNVRLLLKSTITNAIAGLSSCGQVDMEHGLAPWWSPGDSHNGYCDCKLCFHSHIVNWPYIASRTQIQFFVEFIYNKNKINYYNSNKLGK